MLNHRITNYADLNYAELVDKIYDSKTTIALVVLFFNFATPIHLIRLKLAHMTVDIQHEYFANRLLVKICF